MITPRSALKFDLFADTSRKRKIDEGGDPLQVIAQHINFTELAALVDALIERGNGRKGGRPAYPTEVMVRILVLKRLYNRSDKQMEYQLLKLPALLPAAGLHKCSRPQHHLALWRAHWCGWGDSLAARCG